MKWQRFTCHVLGASGFWHPSLSRRSLEIKADSFFKILVDSVLIKPNTTALDYTLATWLLSRDFPSFHLQPSDVISKLPSISIPANVKYSPGNPLSGSAPQAEMSRRPSAARLRPGSVPEDAVLAYADCQGDVVGS